MLQPCRRTGWQKLPTGSVLVSRGGSVLKSAQHRPLAKRFFQRKKAKTNAIVANRALAHKLARASYFVLKGKVEFDPDKAFG